jgi:hypothetical protein
VSIIVCVSSGWEEDVVTDKNGLSSSVRDQIPLAIQKRSDGESAFGGSVYGSCRDLIRCACSVWRSGQVISMLGFNVLIERLADHTENRGCSCRYRCAMHWGEIMFSRRIVTE